MSIESTRQRLERYPGWPITLQPHYVRLLLDVAEAAKNDPHYISSHPGADGFYCRICFHSWPCPATKALAVLEASE